MLRKFFLFCCFLASSFILPPSSFGGPLPSFEDFRRVDRERRLTGQLHTAELLNITRIDPDLIARTVTENADDPKVLWGAAELGGDWEEALRASGTNTVVALRFGCAAALKRQDDVALRWLRHCQRKEPDNLVPWLAELWLLRQQKNPLDSLKPPASATQFRDYESEGARVRIHLLEKAGYSAYSARRLSLPQNPAALTMAQDFARATPDESVAGFLHSAARAMQRRPTFLLAELVGQNLERAVLVARADGETGEEAADRLDQLAERREQLQSFLAEVQQKAVELATESEMAQYFDDVLTLGEETAFRRLIEAVQKQPEAP